MKQIRVTCDTKLRLPLDELNELQGELKEMTEKRYEKFKSLVLKKGIWFALHVWKEVLHKTVSKSEAKRIATVKKLSPQEDGRAVVKWWIIDGHGRKRMFAKLRADGYQIPDIPCVEIEASSLKEAREAILAASSNFQRATGQGMYEFIEASGFDPAVLNEYDIPEIDVPDFMAEYYEEDEPEAEQIPEPPEKPKSKRGELWTLGTHRLLCGDSTSRTDVDRLLAGISPEVTITDPPYGVNYDKSHKSKERGGDENVHENYSWDAPETIEQVLTFLDLVPSDVVVMSFPVDRHFFALASRLMACKLELRKELVWVKNNFSFWMSAKYQQKHEPILWCVRAGKPLGGSIPPDQSTVFEFPKPQNHALHPTAKPLELWKLLVKYHSSPGGWIYEPFGGSGTTLIAAEKLGRNCATIELSPAYVDVILTRWTQERGDDPVREDGVRWSSLKTPR